VTERVQGTQGAWKDHVPGGNGALCCAPQVKARDDFTPPQITLPAEANSVVEIFAAGQCGVDEPLTATTAASPFTPPNVAPSINSIVLTPGTPNLISVNFDTTGALGDFLLEITNACGCCTLVTGTVA